MFGEAYMTVLLMFDASHQEIRDVGDEPGRRVEQPVVAGVGAVEEPGREDVVGHGIERAARRPPAHPGGGPGGPVVPPVGFEPTLDAV